MRRLLSRSAGAISGYITGNLSISVICGIITFVVLLILGMPYAAPLALLVAVLDLIPLVGATLGGALLVIVGLFVEPWKAVVLLVYIVVYQQVEGSVLQPIVYSRAVNLNGLVILIALLVGGQAAWHRRGAAGHPCGGDHPYSGDRANCLPAHDARGQRLRPRRIHRSDPVVLALRRCSLGWPCPDVASFSARHQGRLEERPSVPRSLPLWSPSC